MIKKILRIFMITVIAATTLMLSACSGCARNEDWGYFTVKFYDDRETAYITGLTELGKQQRFLVIPEEIDGVHMPTIGERPPLQMWSSIGAADICSEKLEKVYLISSIHIVSGSFRNSPKLEKAMIITHENIRGSVSPARKLLFKYGVFGFFCSLARIQWQSKCIILL